MAASAGTQTQTQRFADVDYLLSFFPNVPGVPTFPREIMTRKTGGQVQVGSKEELVRTLAEADWTDCYIRSHRHEEAKRGILYIVFVDIDIEGDLERARSIATETAIRAQSLFGVPPHVQFSGAKGYHVIVPIEPVKLESADAARTALKLVQNYISGGECDPHVAGDVVRIFRIPGTINSKGIGNAYGGRVTTLQRWNGVRADFSRAKSIPKELLMKGHAEFKSKMVYETGPLRYYVRKMMEYGELVSRLPHRARHMVACEMIMRGRSDDEIHAFFKHLSDYNREKTQYQIEHARKMGYRYSDAAIEEEYRNLVGMPPAAPNARRPATN